MPFYVTLLSELNVLHPLYCMFSLDSYVHVFLSRGTEETASSSAATLAGQTVAQSGQMEVRLSSIR